MSDQIKAVEDASVGSRLREIRKGEYAAEVSISDAAVGGGTWFDTDNALLISQKTNVLRVETNVNTIDSNVITATTVGGSSTAVQTGGELVLTADTSATGSASVTSTLALPQVPGTTQLFEVVVRMTDFGQANNQRRWGNYTATDGFYFCLDGTSFCVGYRKGGVDTEIPFASCNGVVPDGFWDPTKLNTMTQFNIMYGALSCRWLINGRIVHTIGASSITSPLTNTVNLPVKIETTNIGVTGAVSPMYVRSVSAHRLGPVDIKPRYQNITTATTTVLKQGPGQLRRVIVGTGAGVVATVTLYDNTAASGTKIGTLTISASPNNVPTWVDYDTEFTNGLTVVTSQATDITLVYS